MTTTNFTTEADFKLYNILGNRPEINDLAKKHPEKVAEIQELMFDELNRTGVFPKRGKN